MAKKLIATGYTINASQNQITVPGIIQPVRLLLITDINNNKILYNFADPATGISSFSYNYTADTTTFTTQLDLSAAGVENAIELTGLAGLVSVHHGCTIHGSSRNDSISGRPAFVITYTAADAMPYTAPPYPSSHYRALVRGDEPRYARHDEVSIPLPPDWSSGYTSIFEHQENKSTEDISSGSIK